MTVTEEEDGQGVVSWSPQSVFKSSGAKGTDALFHTVDRAL